MQFSAVETWSGSCLVCVCPICQSFLVVMALFMVTMDTAWTHSVVHFDFSQL